VVEDKIAPQPDCRGLTVDELMNGGTDDRLSLIKKNKKEYKINIDLSLQHVISPILPNTVNNLTTN
jgi:hypothetical protein